MCRGGRGEKRPAPPASAQENVGQETSSAPPPQLSNPSPAAVLPGHVSTGSLPVRPKDFLKPPPPAARKNCESVRRRKPREPNSGCSHQSAGIPDPASRTSFKRPDRPPPRGNPDGPRGCEPAVVCHQELLRMPQ